MTDYTPTELQRLVTMATDPSPVWKASSRICDRLWPVVDRWEGRWYGRPPLAVADAIDALGVWANHRRADRTLRRGRR